jgi:hypothetical protein
MLDRQNKEHKNNLEKINRKQMKLLIGNINKKSKQIHRKIKNKLM